MKEKKKGSIESFYIYVIDPFCPTYSPFDWACSLLGSSVHGILQARILEWVAVLFSWGSFWPGIELGSPALLVDSLSAELLGKPWRYLIWREKKKGLYLLSPFTFTFFEPFWPTYIHMSCVCGCLWSVRGIPQRYCRFGSRLSALKLVLQ